MCFFVSVLMMILAFITWNSKKRELKSIWISRVLASLRNHRTDHLKNDSPSLWPNELLQTRHGDLRPVQVESGIRKKWERYRHRRDSSGKGYNAGMHHAITCTCTGASSAVSKSHCTEFIASKKTKQKSQVPSQKKKNSGPGASLFLHLHLCAFLL